MELLEKETFYYRFNDHLIEPVHCAFFKEENYQGYVSHKEAVLAFLTYYNRVWSMKVPRLVPELTQKLDEVPEVELKLTPEVETVIEANVEAQIEAEIARKRRNRQHVDLKRYDYLKQEQKKYEKNLDETVNRHT